MSIAHSSTTHVSGFPKPRNPETDSEIQKEGLRNATQDVGGAALSTEILTGTNWEGGTTIDGQQESPHGQLLQSPNPVDAAGHD